MVVILNFTVLRCEKVSFLIYLVANSVDPGQQQCRFVSALFAIKYVNLYQQPGLSNLID